MRNMIMRHPWPFFLTATGQNSVGFKARTSNYTYACIEWVIRFHKSVHMMMHENKCYIFTVMILMFFCARRSALSHRNHHTVLNMELKLLEHHGLLFFNSVSGLQQTALRIIPPFWWQTPGNHIVQSKYEKTHHKLQQKQNYYHLVGNFV